MTYTALTTAQKNHQLAARLIRLSGYNAKCVKNAACEQPYQVEAKVSDEQAKEFQAAMESLLQYPINVVCA